MSSRAVHQRRGAPLALLTLLFVVAAEAATIDEIVKRVQARYDSTQDFVAEVTQETTIASLEKTVRAGGMVAFKKPGMMRWDLTQGDPQVIVSDGTTLWVYRVEDKQAVKVPFSNAFRSTTPLSFLTGVGRIAEDFNASLEGQDEKTLTLLLVPKRASSDVGQLRLTVMRDTYDISGAVITDPLGNVSRLTFANLRRNQNLPNDAFVFKVPPGVDVVTAPQQ
jgi:outer membrane lipoprotein carrier protein